MLMPSRFEPCGLTRLYAMTYGTVPVVHGVGGLRDTVPPFDPFNQSGLGWTFHRAEASKLIYALGNCLLTYRDYKRSWVGIQRRGMMQHLSWGNAAQKLFETSSTFEDSNSDEVDTSSDNSSSNHSHDESFVYSQHEIGSSSLLEEELVIGIDSHGVEWDIFHQIDVPKILEYLRKYSDKLSKSCGSPKKVVNLLFDEVFYLDELHKLRIKEEFNVEPWSFEQKIGEVVIIPAGCPYQMTKTNSCVNVVLDFISPESVNNCIKVGDELCRLPVNHKAKKSMPKVKNMVMRHEARYRACAYGSQIRSLSHLTRDKSHYDATRAYAISKLANVLHTNELARRLQAIQKDEDIRTDQKENKARVLREVKERRRKWAEKLTPRRT
ncbi:hypothetical protein L2E82_30363 [Cichorium intybus]|uniref:Uncharacterized protein n=1 Tax=Cichorium intybus TaxID=13427 RepID=A0ACB9D060_CICIN|nr:hypothetical protein L2E82_30363 [Cichorium intybus]